MGEKSSLSEFENHLSENETKKVGKNPGKIEPSKIINKVIAG